MSTPEVAEDADLVPVVSFAWKSFEIIIIIIFALRSRPESLSESPK